jgi:lipase chaperone LimK
LFGNTANEIRSEKRKVPLSITGPADDPKVSVDTVRAGLDAGRSLLNRFLSPTEPAPAADQPDDMLSPDIQQEPVESVDSLLNGLFGK